MRRTFPRMLLRDLITDSGLKASLIKEVKNNLWEVYETLKQTYCLAADSRTEYDRRVTEVVFALQV